MKYIGIDREVAMGRNKRIQKKIEAKKQQAQNRCTMEPEPAQGAPYIPVAPAGHVSDAEPGTSREKERRPAPDAAETAALESENCPAAETAVSAEAASAVGPRAQAADAALKRV